MHGGIITLKRHGGHLLWGALGRPAACVRASSQFLNQQGHLRLPMPASQVFNQNAILLSQPSLRKRNQLFQDRQILITRRYFRLRKQFHRREPCLSENQVRLNCPSALRHAPPRLR